MAEDKGFVEGSRVPNSVPLPPVSAEPSKTDAEPKKKPKK